MRTAEPADLLTADRRARAAATEIFDRPVVLEAGAGTGKTTTLVARILTWCLEIGWSRQLSQLAETSDREAEAPDIADVTVASKVLQGVVAITFTEAAAAEMATRVAEALSAVAREEADRIDGLGDQDFSAAPYAQRAAALIATFDHLTVQTIHSFCRGILADHTLESNLHPNFVVDPDEVILDETIRECVESALRKSYSSSSPDPLLNLATDYGIDPPQIQQAVKALAQTGTPAGEFAEDPCTQERVEELKGRLQSALQPFGDAAAEGLLGLKPKLLGREVANAAHATQRSLSELTGSPVEQLTRLREAASGEWPDNKIARLRNWSRGVFNQGETKALGVFAAQVQAASGDLRRLLKHLQSLDPDLLEQSRQALRPILQSVQERMRSRGAATFTDLLHECAALLRAQPTVVAKVRGGIHQLLVDEFQDTDPLQAEIIGKLAVEEPEGPDDQRPGLFIVGDPKQSIFGWRNADLAVYDEFVGQALARTEGGPETRLALYENFRSTPPILREAAAVVRPIMIHQPGRQPQFRDLVPSRHQEDSESAPAQWLSGHAAVEYWDSSVPAGPTAASTQLAADSVAADIRRLLNESSVSGATRPSDIAILLRSSSPIESYLEALRAQDISYVVTHDRNFFSRREVIDAAALVRAVIHPGDHLALLTHLRSPAVGLPDAALLPLWGKGFPNLMTELNGSRPEVLQQACDAVRQALGEIAEIGEGVPGIERIQGWEHSVLAALHNLDRLRWSFPREAPDRFVERLRLSTLIEASEAARYLGKFRVANLEKFFRHLEFLFERYEGDANAVLRNLRTHVTQSLETRQALPQEGVDDAVSVATIHSAKGLEFQHVYLVETQAKPGRSERVTTSVDDALRAKHLEYQLFGAPTPNFDRFQERTGAIAASERVRLLYVALTRAKDRLVVVGGWDKARQAKTALEAQSLLQLIRNREGFPNSPEDLGAHGKLEQDGIRWRVLAADEPPSVTARRPASPKSIANISQVRQDENSLSTLRRQARARMERPLYTRASARLDRDEPVTAAAKDGVLQRSEARALGTLFHRWLELWNFDADPAAEAERFRRTLSSDLHNILGALPQQPLIEHAEALLDRWQHGSLARRLGDQTLEVAARELPILVPATMLSEVPDTEATQFVSGTIDLLLRHAESQEWLVVDYKTDPIGGTELETTAETHRDQLQTYVTALSAALDAPVSGELWFVWPDRAWHLEPLEQPD